MPGIPLSGRSLDGTEPRYKFPAGFAKSQVVFNLHRAATAGTQTGIVVEEFFDCFKVHQAGFGSVVALMGASLYDRQRRLLAERFASRAEAATLPENRGRQPISQVRSERINLLHGEIGVCPRFFALPLFPGFNRRLCLGFSPGFGCSFLFRRGFFRRALGLAFRLRF
jgi:hypothetical protein